MHNSKSLTCTEQENQPLISICMLCGLRLSLNFHSRRRRACKKWHGNVDGLNFSPSGIKDNFLFTRVVPKCINHTKIPPPPSRLVVLEEDRGRDLTYETRFIGTKERMTFLTLLWTNCFITFSTRWKIFSRGICLLTSCPCKIGIWSTLAQFNLIRQIY